MERFCALHQDDVRAAIRGRHSRHEEEAGRRWKLPCRLIALELDRSIRWTAADGLRHAHSIESFPLQVIQHILRRVVLGSPTRIAFIPDMDVHIDQCRYHRLAGEIHMLCAFGWGDASLFAYGGNPSVLYDERPVLNRGAAVSDDQTR